MKTATMTLKTIERSAQIIFWAEIALIVMLACSYMYIVNKTVWNVVARQKIESNIVALNSKLSDAEFQYITAKNNITLDVATQLGFIPTSQTLFVTRDQASNVAMR